IGGGVHLVDERPADGDNRPGGRRAGHDIEEVPFGRLARLGGGRRVGHWRLQPAPADDQPASARAGSEKTIVIRYALASTPEVAGDASVWSYRPRARSLQRGDHDRRRTG